MADTAPLDARERASRLLDITRGVISTNVEGRGDLILIRNGANNGWRAVVDTKARKITYAERIDSKPMFSLATTYEKEVDKSGYGWVTVLGAVKIPGA